MVSYTSKAPVHTCRSNPVFLKDFEINEVKPTQVIIKTAYASINPVDVKIHAMTFFNTETHTLKDFSGEVVALGSKVQGKLNVGDKVWGSIHRPGSERYVGTYTVADYEEDILAPIPQSLTLEQAASIGVVYGTAFQMLQNAGSKQTYGPDSTILVLGGATAVGSYIIQLAKKHFNIGKVVVTASDKSAEYVKSFGADDVINYRVPDIRKEFVNYVEKSGKKFDAILDAVGGYDAIAVYPKILKPASEGSGYVSIMGDAGPAETYALTMFKAMVTLPRALFRLAFGKYYGINYYLFLLTKGTWIDEAPQFFGTPGVRVPIDSVMPVSDIKEAWAKVDSTRARGKVVVKF